jgi:hypothetical protein
MISKSFSRGRRLLHQCRAAVEQGYQLGPQSLSEPRLKRGFSLEHDLGPLGTPPAGPFIRHGANLHRHTSAALVRQSRRAEIMPALEPEIEHFVMAISSMCRHRYSCAPIG